MSSALLFTGGRLESVTVLSGAPADVNTGFDAAYSDAALQLALSDTVRHFLYDTSFAQTTVAAGHTAFVHGYWQLSHDILTGSGGPIWRVCDHANYEWLRVYSQQDGTLLVQWQSSPGTWTTLGSSYAFGSPFAGAIDLEVRIDIAGNHSAALYRDGTITTAGGDFTAAGFADFASLKYSGGDFSYPSHVSQMIVTQDRSTVGAHVKTSRATGTGAHSAWTGTYADVNEPLDNDTTNNAAAADSLKQAYLMGNVTVLTGYYIEGVFYWLRAKNTGGDPGNIKPLISSTGTEVVGGDMPGIGLGYGSLGSRYDTDPHTSVVWTQAGWNAPAQLGYESAP
jgi:hypothetical protein